MAIGEWLALGMLPRASAWLAWLQVVLAPRLHTHADPFGVTVIADALPQVGLSAWQDANEGLRDAWGMRRIRISQPKPGVIVARGFRREPLEAVIRSPLLGPDGSPVCRPGQFVSTDDVLLGWDEEGTPIVLNLAYSAHALIAGVTRSGKSITVNTLLAYASLMRDVCLIVIDPNLGAVAPWWRTTYKVSDSFHPDEPREILRWVREEMQRRERLFWSGRTDRITNFSPELPLIILAIDEVANYTRHPDRKARERFEAELLAIASQGAKFGVRLWLLTQKPSADVLTTAVRTNLSARICHRVDTTEDFLHLFPDGRELDITAADREMPPGSEALFRAARLHRVAAGHLLRTTGLFPGQEILMMQLWEHGEQRQSDLIKTLGLDASTVTKTLQRMEQAGFVTRRRAELDRRIILVSATRAGQALRGQVEQAWRELEALTVAGMSDEEQSLAMGILERFDRWMPFWRRTEPAPAPVPAPARSPAPPGPPAPASGPPPSAPSPPQRTGSAGVGTGSRPACDAGGVCGDPWCIFSRPRHPTGGCSQLASISSR
ncbi:FtsK/SpoIIIE domain-containing protein [Streptomyces sp. NPDC058674]|uniref:MarR family winged helix-turn-helix transcriptional regulator n=1 Tax=Streptomyces sp. NPDC058674 TaxID=3346592 RepID=UPI00364EBA1B